MMPPRRLRLVLETVATAVAIPLLCYIGTPVPPVPLWVYYVTAWLGVLLVLRCVAAWLEGPRDRGIYGRRHDDGESAT